MYLEQDSFGFLFIFFLSPLYLLRQLNRKQLEREFLKLAEEHKRYHKLSCMLSAS